MLSILIKAAVWKTAVLLGQHQIRMKSLGEPVVLVVVVRLHPEQMSEADHRCNGQ